MADINVERKGPSIWPWIIGLIILALLIWALAALLGDDDEAEVAVTEPVVTPMTTPEPIATGPLCLGEVITDPALFVGQPLDDCNVQVTEVPTDRGFWIQQNGTRMLAIINDEGDEQPIDINPGQTLRISEAVLYDNLADIPGDIDADTRNLAQGEGYFLNVDEGDIMILEGGMPQPGTDPAQNIMGDTM